MVTTFAVVDPAGVLLAGVPGGQKKYGEAPYGLGGGLARR